MLAALGVQQVIAHSVGQVQTTKFFAPETVQMLKDRVRGIFKVWDDAFAGRKFCAGDEVTIADFSLYAGYARIKGAAPDAVEGLPNVARWGVAMGARPAIQRALKF